MRQGRLIRDAVAALAVLAATGCSTPSVQTAKFPDGSEGYVIRCDQPMQAVTDCMREAANACRPYTYRIVRIGDDLDWQMPRQNAMGIVNDQLIAARSEVITCTQKMAPQADMGRFGSSSRHFGGNATQSAPKDQLATHVFGADQQPAPPSTDLLATSPQ